MLVKNSTIEELLLSEGEITYKVLGNSMEPMIRHNRDLVTLVRKNPECRCSENDVVLFKKNGTLVLHRIVEVHPDMTYNILGDNCARMEKNIKEEDIIGIMSNFYREGIHYSISNSNYIDYVNRLRNNEEKRMIKKYIYDIIIWFFLFLPSRFLIPIKTVVRKITNCQIKFD